MKKIFIVAGEASGDIIGGNLVRVMRSKNHEIQIRGIGGEMMAAAGVEITQHYKKIAVMGFIEILSHIFEIKRVMKETIAHIIKYKPDLIITIDSPGFNFRLIKALRKTLRFKSIHYVAPTVWAYNESRAKLVSELYDHILLILPFESQYFQFMPHTFVGHPIVEDKTCLLNHSFPDEILERDKSKLDGSEWTISLLPGSRESEIKKHLKTLVDSAVLLKGTLKKDLVFKILTLPHLHSFIAELTRELKGIKLEIRSNTDEHNKIIQESVIGITKSGTATMRFMANCTPAITFYKISPISAWIIKRRLKISKFNLCNIIMESDVMPELMQDEFTAGKILERCMETLSDDETRANMINFYLETWQRLQQDVTPSEMAAKTVFSCLKLNDHRGADMVNL